MIIESLIEPALLLAEGAESSGGLLKNPMLWRVINLLVFVLVLVYLLRNKIGIGKVFDDRAATITRELEEARKEKKEALERLSEVEARLSRLDQEVSEIGHEAEREAAREAERVRQAAQADAEKIRQMAGREIEGAMKAARTELRAFVADHAVDMAESIIRREIRPDDNSRLLNKYLDELREVNR
ncbi:MAG TPA: F0F1 ATP synthase subunit B [Blastocatellia bacterium]|nr:F0F1 ATP synthase subunit B [Blastocatellia bacterium]